MVREIPTEADRRANTKNQMAGRLFGRRPALKQEVGRRYHQGDIIKKNTSPNILKVCRQPNMDIRIWDKGANMPCPNGFPASARPNTRPRVRGNHGASVAVAVKEEMAVSPSAVTKL